MKHTLIVTGLIVVALAVAGTAVGTHRDWYAQYKAAQTAQHNKAVAEQSARQRLYVEQVNQLKTECTKEQTFYDSQSVVYKKTTARPACSTELVQ